MGVSPSTIVADDLKPTNVENAPLSHVEPRPVPVSALLVSILALGVAAGVNFFLPETVPDYFGLLWLLALIPPFLLAYYRGWNGAALALAAGMVLIIGVEVGGSYLHDRQVRWWIVSGVIVVLISVSLGAGAIAERLHRQTTEALGLAYADSLTGLPNRRILDMFLQKTFAAAQRGGSSSIALFDIDGFKGYNDTRGHSAGDEALKLVAQALRANTRAMNTSGRQGGDEFLSLLPDEGVLGCLMFAERVRADVAEAKLAQEQGITISGGVAAFEPSMKEPKELLDAADRALYAAKSLGGNRIVVNGEEISLEEFASPGALVLDGEGRVQVVSGGDTAVSSEEAQSASAPES